MKKIFWIFIISFILFFGIISAKADVIPIPKGPNLMDMDEYRNIKPDNIKSLNIIRYTIAGAEEKKIKDKNEINQIYNYLKQISLLGETQMSCTDNTTIYSFILKDNSKAVIEIECNWVVMNKKHYNIYIPSYHRHYIRHD